MNDRLPKNKDFLLENYSYDLPPERIAQVPALPRDSSRLLVVNSRSLYTHSIFYNLPSWLLPGDLLVLNNTRVIPARLYGNKSTGAPVEVLLLEEIKPFYWLALVKPGKRFKIGSSILFSSKDGNTNIRATVVEKDLATGGRILEFEPTQNGSFYSLLADCGEIPLPPYITSTETKSDRYQTVFADRLGAVAAPTAGLHFTMELLDNLRQQGIELCYITLHVGVGTFRPVESTKITEHKMHPEWIEVSSETVAKVKETRARGGRVIAVGTTSVRALEGSFRDGELKPFRGKVNLFIYPGYKWQIVEGLITNFHLPGSSLLMLVSALIGRERLFDLYGEAIDRDYRFYSFGDAMLILPDAKI